MARYIKAELALNHTIIYTDDSGQFFRFSGGIWAWRNHNPGNLTPGMVSKRHNQIGSTGKFAIFPDYESGHLALIDCLQTTYANSSIDALVKHYAPAQDGNDVKKYRKFLHDETGVNDNRPVKEFTSDEVDKFWHAIEQMEGYKQGVITEVFPITQVHRNGKGIYNLNVKEKGWMSKEECIKMANQHELDLVICTSQLGHEYLRSRSKSPVNGRLEDLVIKEEIEN